MQNINYIDTEITSIIFNFLPHNSFFDLFFSFLSLKGVHIFGWFLLIGAILIFEEIRNPGIQKRDKLFVVYLILTLAITWLLTFGLKNLMQRPRPCNNKISTDRFKTVPYNNCPSDYSFPSGHSSTSFAAATVVGFFDKKRKWLYFGIAGLISLSRIYLGVHFVLDVVGGAILGYFISRLILYLKKYIPIGDGRRV